MVSPPLRSLAIVGSHPDTRENAPFDDPNYEIWLFNEAPQKPEVYKRWDASLQIHKEKVYSSTENWVNKDHWEWLQKDHGPGKRIFLQDVDPRIPNSVKYPLEGVLSLINRRYLRSSPAEALGLAIYLGYKDISLYGSDLHSNTEYHYQAINYAYWIGFADGRPDITLNLECWHNEFDQLIYGYEGELQLEHEYFAECFREHEIVWKSKSKAYEKFKNKLDRAMLEKKFVKVGELSLQLENCAIALGESGGAKVEALQYSERTNEISRQEFERRSAQAQLDGEEAENLKNHIAGKCEYVWNVWRQTGQLEALNQLREFLREKTNASLEMGKQLGIFGENLAYMNEYDRVVTAAGGTRAVAQALGGKT